ncbi:MAG: tetratricopeptide repeat protein [Alphaproteobacteria bacterium]|nr:tetratricopeptide repeat protein [Alphaproteobacteria bacterium]
MTERTQRRLAAIVLADVVGYSRLMGVDETGTLAALRAHRSELIDPLIAEHGGRIVKTMGDGLLLEFPSVVGAVKCALEIQHGMVERNTGIADIDALRFRIGVHLGDVIVEGDDIFGDGVNVASRIEALADPDGIAISDDAHRQVRDRLDVAWQDRGEHRVKNIARVISVWHWTSGEKQASAIATAASEPPAEPEEASIAVLPFNNMSGDQEQEYFVDGITEDIITELSKIPGLLVISRNSTFTYKGKATKAQDICRDLGVRYVMEGSVRKAGERVRITAQLIDGRSGGHLWAERYDRELADIFAVQDDVTEKIVRALEVNLVEGAQNRPARVETENPAAYDCVLRGREQYRLFSKDANLNARRLYEKAIELDPNYAAAHAGLAMTCLHDWFAGSSGTLDQAYKLTMKANALDPTLPLVYEALGNVYLFRNQYEEAVSAIGQWIEIEPGNADAYANLAGNLQFAGQSERVKPLIEKAMRLNPFYPFYYILYVGQADLAMGRYEEALESLQRSAAHNPEALPTHLYLAACYGHLDQDAPARKALAEVYRIYPDFSTAWVKTYFPYQRAADSDRLIDGLRKAGLSE